MYQFNAFPFYPIQMIPTAEEFVGRLEYFGIYFYCYSKKAIYMICKFKYTKPLKTKPTALKSMFDFKLILGIGYSSQLMCLEDRIFAFIFSPSGYLTRQKDF